MDTNTILADGEVAVAKAAGFLEEEAGVKSAARLFGALMAACAVSLTVTIVVVSLKFHSDAAVIDAAIGPSIIGLAGGVWGALRERN
jgi:hypothetical protein